MADAAGAALSFSGPAGSEACALLSVCQADAFVMDALIAVVIGLQSVEVHRKAIAPMLDRQIERLSCTETQAARLAAVMLSQFAHTPKGGRREDLAAAGSHASVQTG